MSRPRIVVLDDYEQSLRRTADWRGVDALADVEVHSRRLRGAVLLEAIKDADAVVVVRDRTPFKADLIAKLPKLRLFVFTGSRNTQVDAAAMAARGIPIAHTEMGESKASTTEMTWTLILAGAKRLEAYVGLVRKGEWRDGKALPGVLSGQRLGLIGFGGIGPRGGQGGAAVGSEGVTWRPHMSPRGAPAGGGRGG